MKKLLLFFLCILFCPTVSVPQKKHFERLEKLPEGDQIRHSVGSFFGGVKDWNVEEYIFDAPYETVWPAVKRVSEKFAKVGRRPIAGIEEANGRIQNGRISQDALIGMGPGAWLDLFVLEATRVSDTSTKVSVARKVVEKEMTGDRPIKAQWSSGKFERYLLTQIEDEIKNPSSAFGKPVAPGDLEKLRSIIGTYVCKDTKGYFLELKPDGTFRLQMGGFLYSGKYDVSGNALTLVAESKDERDLRGHGPKYKATIQGETIPDLMGMTWVRQRADTSNPAKSEEVLTNADVIRMVEAKLPDAVVIAKVRSSAGKFDTSTDALIKLKQAGVSDAVIQAMIESVPK